MTTTFDRVLDEVGRVITGGTFPEGHTVSVEELVIRTGASRSIVREAVRVLVALGLLSAGRRVGLRVLPADGWDVIDPLVIGWRLDGPDRAAALAELRALRRAVEPEAAAAAARAVRSGTCSADGLEALLAAAATLASAGGEAGDHLPRDPAGPDARRLVAPDPVAWAQADLDLHRLVLELSGNAMFARLQRVVDRALDERAGIDPDAHDVGLHVTLARSVAAGDPDGASAAMREIVDRTE